MELDGKQMAVTVSWKCHEDPLSSSQDISVWDWLRYRKLLCIESCTQGFIIFPLFSSLCGTFVGHEKGFLQKHAFINAQYRQTASGIVLPSFTEENPNLTNPPRSNFSGSGPVYGIHSLFPSRFPARNTTAACVNCHAQTQSWWVTVQH